MQSQTEIGKKSVKTVKATSKVNGYEEGETKRHKFERIAVLRVKKILKSIDVLKNIGRNRSGYEFDNTDTAKIIIALRKKVDELEAAMTNTREEDAGFEL